MEHYYSSDPTSKSEERFISYELNGTRFKFISDNGVFSKNKVDFATDFLLKTIFNDVYGSVLDVGSGYGVIGIVLSKNENVSRVKMVEVNHRAIELSNKNIKLNNAKNIDITESSGFENVDELFDCIVTNPPIRAGKEVLHEIYIGSKEHLKEGGILYIVINKKHGAPSTIKYLNELFGNCEIVDKKAGFHVLKMRRER